MYVTNNGDSNLSQYTVTAGGVLAPKSPATVADGTHPPGVAVSPDGKSVSVTDLYGGRVSQYSVGPGGALVPKSPATVAAGQGPYGLAVTPDGKSVYVADSASNAISQYEAWPQNAKMACVCRPGSAPRLGQH
jgi:DNA-binding beta-propeller fold protein YncE